MIVQDHRENEHTSRAILFYEQCTHIRELRFGRLNGTEPMGGWGKATHMVYKVLYGLHVDFVLELHSRTVRDTTKATGILAKFADSMPSMASWGRLISVTKKDFVANQQITFRNSCVSHDSKRTVPDAKFDSEGKVKIGGADLDPNAKTRTSGDLTFGNIRTYESAVKLIRVSPMRFVLF